MDKTIPERCSNKICLIIIRINRKNKRAVARNRPEILVRVADSHLIDFSLYLAKRGGFRPTPMFYVFFLLITSAFFYFHFILLILRIFLLIFSFLKFFIFQKQSASFLISIFKFIFTSPFSP